ncbi:hypothetical protein [Kutzneria chonburiensis]|uniref:Secreted protein n=1 Tax=Kutzneria chonburiensis TaxID=1483604 RepID=A0ABV6MQZ8_9PSEU|nr:hypothetical protein [Kutzneria chonburiensis]
MGFAVAVVVLLGVVPFVLFTFIDDNTDSGLPAKAADYVGNDPGMPTTGARNFSNGLGALVGPHFALRFTTVEVSRTASYQYEAAPGYEFLLLTIDPATLADAPGPDDDVTAAIMVDGAGHKTSVAAIQRGSGLVVSVATGHTALLKITDTGRTQTLDLRTGKRASDEIQGYYPERALNLSPDTYAQSGKTSSGGCRRQTTMSIDFIGGGTGTAVLPWGPDVGWAKPGRAWLPINYTMLTNPVSVPDYDTLFDLPPACAVDLNFQLDPKQTFAVEFDGGTAAPVKVTDQLLLFDVPVTMTGGTLVIHPAGTFNDGSTHPVVWSEPPPDGRITLAAAK